MLFWSIFFYSMLSVNGEEIDRADGLVAIVDGTGGSVTL